MCCCIQCAWHCYTCTVAAAAPALTLFPVDLSVCAAFRLRRIQSVTLKRFEPGCQLHHDTQLLYELWRTSPDGSQQQLLYVSEQVGDAQ
jgi:hypothetical protein